MDDRGYCFLRYHWNGNYYSYDLLLLFQKEKYWWIKSLCFPKLIYVSWGSLANGPPYFDYNLIIRSLANDHRLWIVVGGWEKKSITVFFAHAPFHLTRFLRVRVTPPHHWSNLLLHIVEMSPYKRVFDSHVITILDWRFAALFICRPSPGTRPQGKVR